MPTRIMIVDDEPAVLALLASQLGHEFAIATATTADQARRTLTDRPTDIVLTDLQLADGSGAQLLDWVHRHTPRSARVLLTGTARVEDAADAINNSRIHRLVLKPWRSEDLLATLRSVARNLLLERSHEVELVRWQGGSGGLAEADAQEGEAHLVLEAPQRPAPSPLEPALLARTIGTVREDLDESAHLPLPELTPVVGFTHGGVASQPALVGAQRPRADRADSCQLRALVVAL